MGQKSSKQKNPWPPYPNGYGPNQPFFPPGFQPPPGATMPYPQHFGQGFIPPGAYGQAAVGMPPPQLAWLPQDKGTKKDKKGKTRAQSEQFPGGFVPGGSSFPQFNVPDANTPVIPNRRSSRPKSTNRRRASTSAAGKPPPLTNSQGSGFPLTNFPSSQDRAHTPFIPADDDDEFTSESEDDGHDRHRSSASPTRRRRRRTRLGGRPRRSQSTSYPITGRIDDVLTPLSPANSAAYGPKGERPHKKLDNPLPEPPRDLYEMTPYKSLLSLPQTTALLTASYGTAQQQNASTIANGQPVGVTTVVIPPGGTGATVIPAGMQAQMMHAQAQAQTNLQARPSVKKKGGLFRSFSKKGREERKNSHAVANAAAPPAAVPVPAVAQPARVQFVPVFVPNDKKPGGSGGSQHGHGRESSSGDHGGHDRNSSFDSQDSRHHTHPQDNNHPHDDHHNDDHRRHSNIPNNAENDLPLEFDQQSQRYAGFMNHSPHRVLYLNKTYPTATHLHEALKYLPDHPQLAENIRLTTNVLEVYPLSATMEAFQREDWPEVFMDRMEEVLLLKFRQHADLRNKLVTETGKRELVYADPMDSFWGLGPQGNGGNHLGRVLMNVRETLRREMLMRS